MNQNNSAGVPAELAKVAGTMQSVISSRHEAADVLLRVAELGRSGNWPSGVTCDQVGQALHRIALNAHEEDPLLGFLNGWRARERKEAMSRMHSYGVILRQRDVLMRETGRRTVPEV